MGLSPEVRRRIEENRVKRALVLDLRGTDYGLLLQVVPEEVRELEHLEQLLLGKNVIQCLPDWLTELPKLQFIQLNQNPLREVGKVRNLVLNVITSYSIHYTKLYDPKPAHA